MSLFEPKLASNARQEFLALKFLNIFLLKRFSNVHTTRRPALNMSWLSKAIGCGFAAVVGAALLSNRLCSDDFITCTESTETYPIMCQRGTENLRDLLTFLDDCTNSIMKLDFSSCDPITASKVYLMSLGITKL